MHNQLLFWLTYLPQWMLNKINPSTIKVPSYWGLSQNHVLDIIGNSEKSKGLFQNIMKKY